jgi:hypothetical protein
MPLNKAALEAQLVDILSNPTTESNVDAIAAAIATAVDTYVKAGLVTGMCPSGGGPLTAGMVT